MATDGSDKRLIFLSRWQQRAAGTPVFVFNVCLLISFSLCYRTYYAVLDEYHVEGLALMLLIAFGLASVAAPFFADSMAGNPQERAKN